METRIKEIIKRCEGSILDLGCVQHSLKRSNLIHGCIEHLRSDLEMVLAG